MQKRSRRSLQKTGTFAPKEVSIFQKGLLLFQISLYVMLHYIYCHENRDL
ncbi:hypothetical protein HMPREF2533_02604 [Bacteroides fragilis]|nr:hypothetical protein HMPREF2530_02604 [Bacteroides fragilis]KXU45076.1 hypothetical protein HMPREF2533_02604 [Bacteroides fragilis]